jgi:DNA repair protein RecO (recombination protein O)
MSLYKSDAVILKNARSGESSLLVYAYLKDGGRQSLLAKGARNPKSAMVGRLEPFTVTEIMYYRSDPEKLGMISQVEVIRNHPQLSEDLRRLSHASAVVESLESIITQSESNRQIFELLRSVLYQLNYCHGSRLEFYFAAFLLQLLSLSGFRPEFRTCVRTGADLSEQEEVLFSAEAGGVISPEAADPDSRYYRLNKGVRRALTLILDSDINKLSGVNFSAEQRKLVRALLLKYLAVHTESSPKLASLDFLDKLAPEG